MITPLKLIKAAKSKNITIACAESVSAGYLSYLLTKAPGSSSVFKGGIVVYSLEAKNKFFHISWPLLNNTQGVSKEVAKQLAQKALKLFNSELAVSITGFAGPTCACGLKPGTVFIGLAGKKFFRVKECHFKGSRDRVRKQSAKLALDLLGEVICEHS